MISTDSCNIMENAAQLPARKAGSPLAEEVRQKIAGDALIFDKMAQRAASPAAKMLAASRTAYTYGNPYASNALSASSQPMPPILPAGGNSAPPNNPFAPTISPPNAPASGANMPASTSSAPVSGHPSPRNYSPGLAQRPQQAGEGLPRTGLDQPQDRRAAALPGTPGHVPGRHFPV